MTRQQEGMEPVQPIPEFLQPEKHDKRNLWTSEELELLIKLYNEGKPYRVIASETGHNINSIVNKVWSVGLHRRKYRGWNESELAILIRMKIEHKSVKDIAKRIKRTEHSIKFKAHTLGLVNL